MMFINHKILPSGSIISLLIPLLLFSCEGNQNTNIGNRDGVAYLSHYYNSGCKEEGLARGLIRSGSTNNITDDLRAEFKGGRLFIYHLNAMYNCCIEGITVAIKIEGNIINLFETEVPDHGGCNCICSIDVTSEVTDLAAEMYTIRIYGNNNLIGEISEVLVPRPQIVDYSKTGCKDNDLDTNTTEGTTDSIATEYREGILYINHINAEYNCCLDDVLLAIKVKDNIIYLYEEEVVKTTCDCLCLIDVTTQIKNLPPGTYKIKICSNDKLLGEKEGVVISDAYIAGNSKEEEVVSEIFVNVSDSDSEEELNSLKYSEAAWAKITPRELLERLRKIGQGYLIVGNAPSNWITEDDVEYLISLIDSQEPAAAVVSMASSYLPFNEPSTVGNETLFMIEGYRQGKYPPTLCSVHYFKPDPVEIKKWWGSRLNISQEAEYMSSDNSSNASLGQQEEVQFSEAERDKILSLIKALSSEVREKFDAKYKAWTETWNDPMISIYSDPRKYAKSRQYEEFLAYCKTQGQAIWPLLFYQLEQGDILVINPLEDLTISDYGYLMDEVREESKRDTYTVEGVYQTPSLRSYALKYAGKLLALL